MIYYFADSAGKKGGEFYTPREVVRLMVQLTKPRSGMRVYDPCVGSGGMLILARQYVEEHGGDVRNLRLYGQDKNGSAWAICKMNMILHGVPDADIQNADTLLNPLLLERGELMRFDRIISNPPFSQNYTASEIKFPHRFHYGYCPETGKKADLMFAQHMLASLEPERGILATVMPHGVLFRGGAEKTIREGFIKDDVLEAVIGLPQNLFYGTGIPACILVMRPKGKKPPERKGKILFINADAEYRAGRAQNYLRPEDVEKIVATFDDFLPVSRYAAVVSREEIERNHYNLNIRRYADNAPPPELHNVRAHLFGGVPQTEIAAQQPFLATHGFDPHTLFVGRDAIYVDFSPNLAERGQIKASIEADHGVQAQEQCLRDTCAHWWQVHESLLAELPITKALMTLRANFLATFADALLPVGMLDRYKVTGVIASWWNESQYELKTLAALGFTGLITSWTETIRVALEEQDEVKSGPKINPLEHKLVKCLLPDYLTELADAEAHKADLEARLAATKKTEGDDESDDSSDEAEELSKEEIKQLKKDVAEARKQLRELRDAFLKRLEAAVKALSLEESQRLVLNFARADLALQLERYIAEHRQQITAIVESWWDRYRVPLRDIEAQRDDAQRRLDMFLEQLGYSE